MSEPLNPTPSYLLICQVGPVQDFIALARSTRDCWSGSFLLSWMMAQWIAKCRQELPHIEFVFPVLEKKSPKKTDVPTLDWIEGHRPTDVASIKNALLPAITNRVMASIPAGHPMDTTQLSQKISQITQAVFNYDNEQSVWRKICKECYEYLATEGVSINRHQWDFQLRNLWQVAWQLWPYEDEQKAWSLFKATPLSEGVSPEPGNSWHPNYQLAGHRLDARRHLRDFAAWTKSLPENAKCPDRDAYSGKEEAVLSTGKGGYFESIQPCAEDSKEKRERKENLRQLFRKPEPLGAPMALKRVWHRAYLEKTQGFQKTETYDLGDTYFNMPSLPAIAAYPWAKKVRKEMMTKPAVKEAWRSFASAIQKSSSIIEQLLEITLPKLDGSKPIEGWFDRVDWDVFQLTLWASLAREASAEQSAAIASSESALRTLREALAAEDCPLGDPGRHYAVLAMDGDGMGKWLSGQGETDLPADATNKRVLTREYHEALSKADQATQRVSFDRKLLTRAYHEALSKGLVEVAAKNVHQAMEEPSGAAGGDPPFQGKVIYAGADDLLVILPADQAIEAAAWFNNKFREGMNEEAEKVGFEPNLTASAGIAIGQFKAPLQDMVEVAQKNLKDAKKKRGRNALQLTLFKRSGEIVHWGCKFSAAALPLLQDFQGSYRTKYEVPTFVPPISRRFPHKLAEVLRPFAELDMTPDLKAIVQAEFAFVCSRQIDEKATPVISLLKEKATAYLEELISINEAETEKKKNDPTHEPQFLKVADFIHLFQTEAFLCQED